MSICDFVKEYIDKNKGRVFYKRNYRIEGNLMIEEKLFTRNFGLLVLGQISSLFGNFILKFALSMYVLEITGSASVFAGILAMATIPTIVLSPLGGILADHANRRNIMVTLDALSGFTVLVITIFLTDQNAIWMIAIVMVVLSILGAFESPTVQACVPQMHKEDNIVKANAVVNQVAAISNLIAPILGSTLYTVFGIRRILPITMLCFFATAILECFIKLEYTKQYSNENIRSIIKSDFKISIRFILKEQKDVLKILLLAAAMNFLLMGVIVVGLPYFIRTVLGLNANYYGAAESFLGVAAIAGSIAVGFLISRLKIQKIFWLLVVTGIAVILCGFAFILPVAIRIKYGIIVISAFIIQFSASIFSVFILSIIQQKTPNEILGKIMAYIATISLCAQPLGQAVYGVLFDYFAGSLCLILLITGIMTCILGLASKRTFHNLAIENNI